ncbi:MAG: hypothetical protein [Caudovirales sp. ctOwN3]|nr:MAG: hypothetical protein [Caudovirales sp. ctOwN3]
MADKDSLLQLVAQQLGPENLQRMVDQVEQQLSQDPDVMDDGVAGLQELINQLSFVAERPEAYKDVVTSAIQAGVIDPADAPAEFDPIFIAVMILALEELLARMNSGQGFAKGGLASAAKKLAAQGRGGDTMLAHINPREAEVLRRMGGVGTVNPHTGLHEFKGGIFKAIGKVFKSVAKIAVPVVANMIVPGWGGAIAGAAMGAMGGGGLKGALLGGLSGSLIPGGALGNVAQSVGSGITNMLPSSIGSMVSKVISPSTLGAGVLGGLGGAVTGQGFLPGALMAGGMSAAAPTIEGLTSSAKNYLTGPGGVFSSQAGGTGVNLGSVTPGSSTPGINLGTATSGAATPGINLTPFDAGAAVKDTSGNWLTNLGQGAAEAANAGNVAGASQGSNLFGMNITPGTVLTGLTALNALGGATIPQAQMAIANSGLTEEQKAAMNRELTDYTAKWNTTTLPAQGTPEYTDLMNRIQQGIGINFMNPTLTAATSATPAMAKGGPLTRLAMGSGHGRSDTINARLSDGEYVIDAETVALLGNGSTKAGAAALDQMRQHLRKQKGKALAKGKFSPDAMSPLAYMKGGLK